MLLIIIVIQSLLQITLALPEITIAKKSYSELDGIPPELAKRTGTLVTNSYAVLTWSVGGAYYANVSIGTPPQDQVVILDTGSSDLYFDAYNAPACQDTSSRFSCRGGTFNSAESKTYKVVDPAPAFNTSFQDGSTAQGPFAVDTFSISDVTVENVQFGLAEKLNSTTGYAVGLMGLGYSQREATKFKYPNVPDVLCEVGVINSRLYSIHLNDINTGSGSILFGGVDTSKFQAPLITINLLPNPNTIDIKPQVNEFVTTVTDLEVKVGGRTSSIISKGSDSVTAYSDQNTALAVLLDTGSSAWSVPPEIYSLVHDQFPYIDKNGLCACTYRDSGDTLTLTFAGKVKITVPAQEFIVPIYDQTSRQPIIYDTDGNTACSFMITGDDSGYATSTLGDAVLRSMYVVLDLDNGQISMAQAVVNSTGASNIVTIPAGPNGVASAVPGASSASTHKWAIAPQISVTEPFVASTAASRIGTATGIDAVPTEARPSSSTSSSSLSSLSSSLAAAVPAAPTAATSSTDASQAFAAPAITIDSFIAMSWVILMAASGTAIL